MYLGKLIMHTSRAQKCFKADTIQRNIHKNFTDDYLSSDLECNPKSHLFRVEAFGRQVEDEVDLISRLIH